MGDKTTILYQEHIKLGATMTPFGGYIMPLYYSSIKDEHLTVREFVGMFDISHMGQILIEGDGAYSFLEYMLSQKLTIERKMKYSFLLNENAGIIDDLMIYPFNKNKFMLVVNASNKEKVLKHLFEHLKDERVKITDQSFTHGILAVQGPKSEEVISKILKSLPSISMTFIETYLDQYELIISRSGYTGEDGFEIYAPYEAIINLWHQFLSLNIKPCGLGSRDTLRFEASMPLYGHEIDETINPYEAGLMFGVSLEKDNFIGKKALLASMMSQKRKSVGIELLERNVPREGYKIFVDDKEIGHITTGYLAPSLNKPLAIALVDVNYSRIGTQVYVMIRNKLVKAIIRNKRFYVKKNNVKE